MGALLFIQNRKESLKKYTYSTPFFFGWAKITWCKTKKKRHCNQNKGRDLWRSIMRNEACPDLKAVIKLLLALAVISHMVGRGLSRVVVYWARDGAMSTNWRGLTKNHPSKQNKAPTADGPHALLFSLTLVALSAPAPLRAGASHAKRDRGVRTGALH